MCIQSFGIEENCHHHESYQSNLCMIRSTPESFQAFEVWMVWTSMCLSKMLDPRFLATHKVTFDIEWACHPAQLKSGTANSSVKLHFHSKITYAVLYCTEHTIYRTKAWSTADPTNHDSPISWATKVEELSYWVLDREAQRVRSRCISFQCNYFHLYLKEKSNCSLQKPRPIMRSVRLAFRTLQ